MDFFCRPNTLTSNAKVGAPSILICVVLLSSCGSTESRPVAQVNTSSQITSESICPKYTDLDEDQWLARSGSYEAHEERRFLNENRSRSGVVELGNGLQYKVLKNGCGDRPLNNSQTIVRYHATLLDGTVFDSSFLRNEANLIPLNRVISGWRQAVTRMQPGAIWEVYMPSRLAYGSITSGPIPANSALIFTIELISFE